MADKEEEEGEAAAEEEEEYPAISAEAKSEVAGTEVGHSELSGPGLAPGPGFGRCCVRRQCTCDWVSVKKLPTVSGISFAESTNWLLLQRWSVLVPASSFCYLGATRDRWDLGMWMLDVFLRPGGSLTSR